MGLTKTIKEVLAAWALTGPDISVSPIGTGHIHQSFKVYVAEKVFCLQKLNGEVFPDLSIISNNLSEIGKVNFFGEVASLPTFIPTLASESYATDSSGESWRLIPWIEISAMPEAQPLPQIAYNTAKAFGAWTSVVNHEVSPEMIRPAIAGFHDLPVIYQHFLEAWNSCAGSRKHQAAETCARLSEGSFVLEIYNQLSLLVPQRIIHGDAKADNILTGNDQTWIIDLDTVMPGYLWMDVGDMVRSMACSLPESSEQLDQICIIPKTVEFILEGYGAGIGDLANPLEIGSLRLGACCIIYEQAIRFLTDFLNGDRYYPVSYPDENLVRAQNQLLLWECYVEIYQTDLSNFLMGR